MEEQIVLTVKNMLGTVGLAGSSESVVRWVRGFTAGGKRANAQRQNMISFYSKFIDSGDLCFDVGANLGNRVEIFLKLGAKVIAIEPQDRCMQYLKLRYRNPRQVVLVHKGLDSQPGERQLLMADESAVSTMNQEWVQQKESLGLYTWDRVQVVPVTTLDILIREQGLPVFCKIDVEGFEYQVLKGLTQPIKVLSIEYHCDFLDPVRSCLGHLMTLGEYEFNYSVGETMKLALEQWVSDTELLSLFEALPNDSRAGDVYARLKNK